MDKEIEVKIENEPFSLSEGFIEGVSEFEKLQKIHVSPDKKVKTSSEKVVEDLTIKILIKCNGRAAVVNIESDLSFITLQDIKRIAAKYLGEPLASNVDRFSIFRFEMDFREWVLLKDASSLRNLDKLEFRESDPVNSENKKRVLFKWGHKAAVVDVERKVSVEELTKLAAETFKITEKMELYIYNEDFDENILLCDTNKLRNKQRIEIRRELDASKSYECNLPPSRYPSTIDYENITKALLDQYPKMYSKDGYQVTFERWKKSISEKFRNERDRIDSSTLPEALCKQLKSKKRHTSSNGEMESSSKKEKGLQSLKFNIEKKEIVSDMCNDAGGSQNDEIREATEVPLEVESTSPHSSQGNFWSHNFKLPPFGFATIKMETLRRSEQSTILKAIFQEVVNLHGILYPSSFDYDCITKALLGQYPNLVSKDGYQLTFKRWKKSISQNFRNERDRMDLSSLPQVLLKQLKEKKRQSSSNDKTESPLDEAEDLQSLKSLIEAHEYMSGEADIERGKIFEIREEAEAEAPVIGKKYLIIFSSRKHMVI